ncbi:DNA polymerase III subunit delta [Synechocystis sp. PCC 7509]|uniref:DNA polymerase III subunit delta n=1 Tax=Synechocystis sp. PCC 7509 TaxID=927677 RepID=UPI0002AC5865|nr:DNA polymerase III subunit delta [Synechocystis sp. PCC 7509]
MPIYYYWGDDEFAIASTVTKLRDRTVDPNWASFNYTQHFDTQNAAIEALNQAMTPAFGSGSRLVWLVNTTIGQQCPEELLIELKRTLPVIPNSSVLLLTSRHKPDGRLKSTALWKEYAEIKEFPLIPPWETKLLIQQVEKIAQEVGVKLTDSSTTLMAQSVGNDTRQLYNELTKLRLYAGESQTPISTEVVNNLVQATSQTSLDLVKAIVSGNTAQSLTLVAQLLNRNEPGLKIVATLVGQFRTWLWVKIMTEAQERDKKVIAQAAEIGNPNRVYFLQQEVKILSVKQLAATLPLLLELEANLKLGGEEMALLQTKVIQLCQLFL